MGPLQAAKALELLRSEKVAPMHWRTYPVLRGTPDALDREVKKLGLNVEVLRLKPGVGLEL